MNHPRFLSFVLATFALLASPGPGTLALAANGAAYGFRGSIRFLIGTMIGLIIAIIVAVAVGLFAVILTIPYVRPALLSLSLAYLAWLAFSIATATPLANIGNRLPPSLAGGLTLGLTNPKAYAAFAALFAGFVIGPATALDQAIKAITCLVVMVISELFWLSAGNLLRKPFTHPQWSRLLNVGLAAAMVIAVAWSLCL